MKDKIIFCQACNKPYRKQKNKKYLERFNVEGLKVCVKCKKLYERHGDFEYVRAPIPKGTTCSVCDSKKHLTRVGQKIYCLSHREKLLSKIYHERQEWLRSLPVDELLAIVRDEK